LGELYAAEWAKFAKGYAKRGEGLPENEQAKMRRTVAAGDYLGEHLFEAPIVVIVCFEPAMLAITDIKQDRPSVVGGGSIYTAVQNLLLACRAEGVGAVLTTLLCQVEPEVKSLLDIPDNFATAAMVPIGYPVGKGYGPTARKEIAELFFADSWGDKFNS
jgi:nitroreductase